MVQLPYHYFFNPSAPPFPGAVVNCYFTRSPRPLVPLPTCLWRTYRDRGLVSSSRVARCIATPLAAPYSRYPFSSFGEARQFVFSHPGKLLLSDPSALAFPVARFHPLSPQEETQNHWPCLRVGPPPSGISLLAQPVTTPPLRGRSLCLLQAPLFSFIWWFFSRFVDFDFPLFPLWVMVSSPPLLM